MSTVPRRRKPGARKAVAMESFVFEIVNSAPTYSLNVAFSANEGPYREFAHLTLSCRCVFPKQLSGIETKVIVIGDRDCLEPECWKADPRWRPRCVGQLEVRASRGRFYAGIPYDSLTFLLLSIRQGDVRMIYLWGPPLYRGKSLCTSIRFERDFNEDDL
jgi:hypothetical protein